ncbi:MAG: FecR domain-containing protein [Verrucomicrobiota bacterium]
MVGVIARELEGRRRRRVVRRWALGTAAASLVVLAVFGEAWRVARIATEGQASLEPHDMLIVPSEPGGSRVVVAAGTRLAAPESGPLRLASADGTELTLEPGGTLSVIELGPTRRFALTRGAVLAHVSKLGSGERFIIDTADVEVEVHGTRFRVAVSPGPFSSPNVRAPTKVSVSEGVVAVSGPTLRVFLFPGDEWPTVDPPAARSPSLPGRGAASGARAVGVGISRGVAGPRPALARADDPSGTKVGKGPPAALQAQNDRFMAGVFAKRNGNDGEALRQFERFIRTYPNSTLAESAVVERMRLLSAKSAWAATAAAADYLSRYPDGFARAEARRLIDPDARP